MSPLTPEKNTDIDPQADSSATSAPVNSAENTANKSSGKNEKHPIAEIIQFVLLALIIVVPIRLFVAQPFIVSGASMENTFHTNEYLIVDQLSYHFNKPQRGDVIIFRYPRDPSKFFIKRVIGLPGETVEIQGSAVTIKNNQHPEGITLDETYIKTMQENTFLTETTAAGEYFVMGDNRDASSDSRVWGVLKEDAIVGRALFRLFPFDEVEVFPGEVQVGFEEVTSTN